MCKLVQLGSPNKTKPHAIAEETTESRVKNSSKGTKE